MSKETINTIDEVLDSQNETPVVEEPKQETQTTQDTDPVQEEETKTPETQETQDSSTSAPEEKEEPTEDSKEDETPNASKYHIPEPVGDAKFFDALNYLDVEKVDLESTIFPGQLSFERAFTDDEIWKPGKKEESTDAETTDSSSNA